jgi:anti-sigma B factor antagonist
VAETLLVDYAGENDTALVRFIGELDLCGAERAKEAGLAALSKLDSDGSPLIIDLSELTFCDSRGLQALVDIEAQARAHGHVVVLRRPQRAMRRLFTLLGLGLDDLFTIDEGPSGSRVA